MIELALVNKLRNNTPAGSRIYPEVVPEGATQACITYQRIYTRDYPTFGGDAGVETPRFQLSCISASKIEALSIAKAVSDLLNGFSGELTDGAGFSTQASALRDNQFDAGYEKDTKRYRTIVEVSITYKKSVRVDLYA